MRRLRKHRDGRWCIRGHSGVLRAAYGIQQEKTADQGKEKHVPIIEKTTKGIIVKVGSVPHPMEEKHYIEWIEVRSGDNSYLKWLHPGEKAEA